MPAFAEDYQVRIPQGAHNRLCATFHNCYSPEEIKIQTGDTISWPNEDSEPHTITSGKPGKSDGYFDSGLYKPRESWSFTFNESGVFDYYCTIHPWMAGEVAVAEEPKTSTFSIPDWIKVNAGWWAKNQIKDADFIQGIQFLIKQDIIRIPTSQTDLGDQSIPKWIKTSAGWWSEEKISDSDFIEAIQYLIINGIIKI